jgi:hypothetical protein
MTQNKNENAPSRIVRLSEARRRLGKIGRTAFDMNFLRTGRLRKVQITKRCVGVMEDDLERVISEIAAAAGE